MRRPLGLKLNCLRSRHISTTPVASIFIPFSSLMQLYGVPEIAVKPSLSILARNHPLSFLWVISPTVALMTIPPASLAASIACLATCAALSCSSVRRGFAPTVIVAATARACSCFLCSSSSGVKRTMRITIYLYSELIGVSSCGYLSRYSRSLFRLVLLLRFLSLLLPAALALSYRQSNQCQMARLTGLAEVHLARGLATRLAS
jgi:hypothetical protein